MKLSTLLSKAPKLISGERKSSQQLNREFSVVAKKLGKVPLKSLIHVMRASVPPQRKEISKLPLSKSELSTLTLISRPVSKDFKQLTSK
jgi:hypothetical protein